MKVVLLVRAAFARRSRFRRSFPDLISTLDHRRPRDAEFAPSLSASVSTVFGGRRNLSARPPREWRSLLPHPISRRDDLNEKGRHESLSTPEYKHPPSSPPHIQKFSSSKTYRGGVGFWRAIVSRTSFSLPDSES